MCSWQVKWPDGKKHEDIFVDTLLKYGYKGKYQTKEWMLQPLFIQSFAPQSLIHASKLTDSPMVLLIDNFARTTQDTNQVDVWPPVSSLCLMSLLLIRSLLSLLFTFGLQAFWVLIPSKCIISGPVSFWVWTFLWRNNKEISSGVWSLKYFPFLLHFTAHSVFSKDAAFIGCETTDLCWAHLRQLSEIYQQVCGRDRPLERHDRASWWTQSLDTADWFGYQSPCPQSSGTLLHSFLKVILQSKYNSVLILWPSRVSTWASNIVYLYFCARNAPSYGR